MKAERLTAPVTWHGEGPFWDAVAGRLLVVDMMAGTVVDLADPDHPRRTPVGSRVAAVVRRRTAGGFLVATEHGVSLLDDDLVLDRRLPDLLDDPAIRLNEGGCDPSGRFYVGSMAYDQSTGAASVYRVDPDGSAATVLTGVTISNGLQWSPDGTRAFYVDTPTRRIDVIDVDPADGSLHDRRPLVTLPDDVPGNPDGLTIDAEGGLWAALYGAGAVHRYDGAGALTEVVEVPGASHTTAPAFGGPDLDTLFVTTSRENLPDGAEPDAGAVFAVRPGVRGVVLPTFGG